MAKKTMLVVIPMSDADKAKTVYKCFDIIRLFYASSMDTDNYERTKTAKYELPADAAAKLYDLLLLSR